MVLFCIFILIPIITANPFVGGPSYRSSVMEGDKPILRMPVDVISEEDSSELVPLRTADDARMVKDLSLLIGWLVENFGYDLMPQGRRSKDDMITPINEPVKKSKAARVSKAKGKKPGKAVEKRRKKLRKLKFVHKSTTATPAPVTIRKKEAKRVQPTQEVPKPSEPPEPIWMIDLKEFIRDLVTRIGQRDLDRYTKPVIHSLEKKHNMKITDIDVDQYGDVLISYTDNKKSVYADKEADEPSDDETKLLRFGPENKTLYHYRLEK